MNRDIDQAQPPPAFARSQRRDQEARQHDHRHRVGAAPERTAETDANQHVRGQKREARAGREVIVACGAVQSPGVLEHSGIGQLARACNSGDATAVEAVWGAGFADISLHPWAGEAYDALIAQGVAGYGSYLKVARAGEAPAAVFKQGVPVLGICYGMFTMAVQLGGSVEASDHREFGHAEVRARGHTKLFEGIEDTRTPEGHGMLHVWMSHGDKVTEMPPGFKLMASTPSCPIAGMADEERGFYAVQFHPEVTHTKQGAAMLRRFVLDICKASPTWTMPNYIETAVARIREQVGNEEVILGLSGGVDSAVTALLMRERGKSHVTEAVAAGLQELAHAQHAGEPVVVPPPLAELLARRPHRAVLHRLAVRIGDVDAQSQHENERIVRFAQ